MSYNPKGKINDCREDISLGIDISELPAREMFVLAEQPTDHVYMIIEQYHCGTLVIIMDKPSSKPRVFDHHHTPVIPIPYTINIGK